MKAERFEGLAQAYGGDVGRWPLEERDAAAAVMAADPAWTGAVLARASVLDDALDAYRAPEATGVLAEAIAASAPRAGPRHWRTWLAPAGLGAGLAAACAAGVIAGVQWGPTLVPVPAPAVAGEADDVATAADDEDFNLFVDEDA